MTAKIADPYKMTEADVKAEILKKLNSLPGVFAYKHYSGGKYGLKGIHDIIVCFHGLFISIECKNPYLPPEYSPDQEKFAQWVKDGKGQSICVNSWAQVVEKLKINEALLTPDPGT